jgi:archaellum component FlaC
MKENGNTDSRARRARARTGDSRADRTGSEVSSIDKVRELIFGQAMADYDNRFAELEATIKSVSDALRDDVARQVQVLADKTASQFASLSDEIREEKSGRGAAHAELTAELQRVGEQVENDLKRLRDESAKSHKTLGKEMERGIQELRKALEAGLADLDESKLDRQALADAISLVVGRIVSSDST